MIRRLLSRIAARFPRRRVAAPPAVRESAPPPPPQVLPAAAYVLVAPLSGKDTGWAVFNCAANRLTAAGLTQGRAMTLCRLLNLADDRRTSRSDAVQRKGR
jgi:hypothetical protein